MTDWTHSSAESQVPDYASFQWLSNDRRFTDFYCRQSSYGDSDSANIERMSCSINQLIRDEFSDDPLANYAGNPERVQLLKRRVLQEDVALVVNDKCHVFAWIGDHCEKYRVPTLNLCPSQHEIQRRRVGLLECWRTIFANLSPVVLPVPDPPAAATEVREEYAVLDRSSTEVPLVPGLYITFSPLIPDTSLLPEGRVVAGPVYPPYHLRTRWSENFQSSTSDVKKWLDDERGGGRPVVYVSLGSMVKVGPDIAADHITLSALGTLIRALAEGCRGGGTQRGWRVLMSMNPSEAERLCGGIEKAPASIRPALDGPCIDILCAGWLPQFDVLAHSAVAVFVTHCGANSVHEAIFHEVPMVGLPFFDDQRYNAPRLVELGLSSACLLREGLTVEKVTTAIRQAMDSPCIAANLSEASKQAKQADGLNILVTEAVRLASVFSLIDGNCETS